MAQPNASGSVTNRLLSSDGSVCALCRLLTLHCVHIVCSGLTSVEEGNTAACVSRTRRRRSDGPMHTRTSQAAPPPMPVPVSATVCNALLFPPLALAARAPRRPLSSPRVLHSSVLATGMPSHLLVTRPLVSIYPLGVTPGVVQPPSPPG